ncbi:DegT/DnrJ/EryC1/StrS family aminotransferase [Methylobacterium sp. J-070]|uniref:DegT/DnrJ/EryC1/StrS family aminotransferase n=1 Tax=Methylobacterium sp. J-070 TaxID=2836650 RepID=UPI0028C3B5EA|nr:DegT/DnrJ/EryC1/StrS family aminotransferase [Methylobacterium sp. J-070]
MSAEPIAFIDLQAQRRRLGARLDEAVLSAINEANFILGRQVAEFERALESFCGAKHAIGCGNGTDAIALCLMALNLRPGDAVLVPSFTFASTAEVVAWLGASPVFVDIEDETYTLDPAGLEQGIAAAKTANLIPRALISVDLFGQPADYDPIEAFCAHHGLTLICDAAQGLGASYQGRLVGSVGTFTTTSFFPSKPLGCYGDGGAILTDDERHAELLRSLHVHGRGTDKYDNVRIGVNSRLDTLQAAVLLEKLAVFPEEIAMRDRVAGRYQDGLADVVSVPRIRQRCTSVWAQFTIRVAASHRAAIVADLKAKGIPTAIYYPKPLHRQTAYRHYPCAGNGLPVSDRVADEVLSLPMHPDLDAKTQDVVIAAVRECVSKA